MDNETAKALGCLFLAIVHSLTDEHRAEIAAQLSVRLIILGIAPSCGNISNLFIMSRRPILRGSF